MLKRLRRQFVLIVMMLVGTVLVAVLGSAYLASWQTQQSLIEESLEHGLYGDFEDRPSPDAIPRGEGRRDALFGLCLVIEVDDEGISLEANDTPAYIDLQTVSTVVRRVIEDGELQGTDRSLSVSWSGIRLEDDDWRIAIVDTTNSNALLREQAKRDLQIICLALLALFAISWWLSDWALRPVERAWEQQRRFVSDASHELKTPLAVILANTQILQADESLGTELRRWVDSTAEEAAHMKALVGDLLQLARADETAAGVANSAMRHDDIDLSELVEAASLEFDAIAFERGCLLEDDVQPGLHLTGDREWIDRLVRILIDNACKYGESGTNVTVRLKEVGGKTQLTVHNLGNPIDAEDLPHVFERFYRSDKARQREGEGGFGLGLAIAKGIVDSHGGKISVASNEEAGTTFTVVF